MQFPKKVKVVEVGPRDGFQNVKIQIPTETKLDIIEALIAAGVRTMEVTSFVHPKAIPQMADAAEVAKRMVEKHGSNGLNAIALVPNLTGAKNAFSCGIREVTYVISASEMHNLKNINRTREQSLEELKVLVQTIPELKVRLDVATAFGCPFMGKVDDESVISLIQAALDCGIKEVVLCDTIGIANPNQVYNLVQKTRAAFEGIPIGLHMHDTRGMGLANTLAGLNAGITLFEASVGGLGGCPFAPGAAGNTATEDMINMLHSMGIETGIQLDEYIKVVRLVQEQIQNILTSHMVNACSYENI
ncbi:MAG: hydroxymethylglutaryl-CoA lyase [Ruminiclostridium sp.]